jgi:hypothetical protein
MPSLRVFFVDSTLAKQKQLHAAQDRVQDYPICRWIYAKARRLLPWFVVGFRRKFLLRFLKRHCTYICAPVSDNCIGYFDERKFTHKCYEASSVERSDFIVCRAGGGFQLVSPLTA